MQLTLALPDLGNAIDAQRTYDTMCAVMESVCEKASLEGLSWIVDRASEVCSTTPLNQCYVYASLCCHPSLLAISMPMHSRCKLYSAAFAQ
jgi:hypothetical protein